MGFGYVISIICIGDSGVWDFECEFKIVGVNEVMIYCCRLKDIFDQMIVVNFILQKICKGEFLVELELKILMFIIFISYFGVSLDLLNEFYGCIVDQFYLMVCEIIGLDFQVIEDYFKDFLYVYLMLMA